MSLWRCKSCAWRKGRMGKEKAGLMPPQTDPAHLSVPHSLICGSRSPTSSPSIAILGDGHLGFPDHPLPCPSVHPILKAVECPKHKQKQRRGPFRGTGNNRGASNLGSSADCVQGGVGGEAECIASGLGLTNMGRADISAGQGRREGRKEGRGGRSGWGSAAEWDTERKSPVQARGARMISS